MWLSDLDPCVKSLEVNGNRPEMVSWYERMGYSETDDCVDAATLTHMNWILLQPMFLIRMEKDL